MAKTPPLKPWHRWPGESAGVYQHFQDYLHQPPGRRSPARLATSKGLSAHTTRGYAKAKDGRPSWADRAKGYDRDRAEAAAIIPVEDVESMVQSHAEIWAKVRAVATKSIQARLDRGEELTARETVAWAEAACKWERLALGKATDRTAIDLENASEEELNALEALAIRTGR